MRRSYRSFRYAMEGLTHAVSTERNLRHFVICYGGVLAAGLGFGIGPWEWMAIIGAGGTFIAVELINTAFERVVNACDELYRKQGRNHHDALKQTKDVAAGAALVTLVAAVLVISIVFYPYMQTLVQNFLYRAA